MLLLVGLGNPGKEYAGNRHNIGSMAINEIVRHHGFSSSRTRSRPNGVFSEGMIEEIKVVTLKPLTYMNLSGNAIRDILAFYRVGAGNSQRGGAGDTEDRSRDLTDSVLVVYDDLDLRAGRIRYRARGSAGGHRGVSSVAQELRTQQFGRLRVGIGRDAHKAAEDYVLEALDDDERDVLQRSVGVAAETLDEWVRSGVRTCANRYNADPDSFEEDADL